MSGWGLSIFRHGAAAGAVMGVFLFASAPVFAQMRSLVSPQSQSTVSVPLTTVPGSPGATILAPAPLAPPVAQAAPVVPAGRVVLAVAARYGHDAPPINGGLIWRVYAAKPDSTGVFRL